MKKLKDGDPFPKDFWNYLINPIVGYYVEKEDKRSIRQQKKYYKLTQKL